MSETPMLYGETERFTPHIETNIYLPRDILTNEEVESWNISDTEGKSLTAESIKQKTGIEHRFIAQKNETTLEMADRAALPLLAKGGSPELILFSSSYPVGVNQAEAFIQRNGLDTPAWLEIGAACSGFTRGLTVLRENEAGMQGVDVLFVSSEKYSDTCADLRAEEDPSLAQLLFSDGATAVRFRYGEDLQVLGYANKHIESDDIQMPIDETKACGNYLSEPVPKSPDHFRQNGRNVLKTVGREIPALIEEAIGNAEVEPGDVKIVIPHQPSKHVLGALSKRSEYPFVADFEAGNFSSASIPKALHKILSGKEVGVMQGGKSERQKVDLQKGDVAVLAGFGAGFYASVAVVRF